MPLTPRFANRKSTAPTTSSVVASRPPGVRWRTADGGNHSQFGWYGTQLGDGRATIDRAQQQAILLDTVLDVLRRVDAVAGGR